MSVVTFDEAVHMACAVRAMMDVHGWARNECFIAARTTMEIARYFGWPVLPLPVAVMFKKDQIVSGTSGDGSVTFAATPTSAADGLLDTSWNGHLIVLLNKQYIVDVTADQFSKPDHGMTIPGALVLDVDDGQKVRTGTRFAGYDDDTGMTCLYQVIDDHTWYNAPYWREADYWHHLVDDTIAAIDGSLVRSQNLK